MPKHILINQIKYFPNLDASRFFGFILVFLGHCFITTSSEIKSSNTYSFIVNWGKVGVLGLEYFFVLSSFLITWIILKEQHLTNSFSIKNFIVRRTLRVWPLYFLVVLIGYGIFHWLSSMGHNLTPLPDFYHFGLFTINFYVSEHGINFLFFLAFLWSISIEEQYYLFYSLITKYIKPNILLFCSLMIISSLVFRFFFLDDDKQLYFNTFSALGNFGIGGITAFIAFYQKPIFTKLTNRSRSFNIVFYIVLLLSIIFYHQINSYWFNTLFIRIYFSLLFAYMIIEQACGKNRWFNMGKSKRLDYWGKISFGLYCFHGITITLLIKALEFTGVKDFLISVYLVYPIIILIVTIILSHLSFKYYEKYFLNLKNQFYTFTNK